MAIRLMNEGPINMPMIVKLSRPEMNNEYKIKYM